MADRHKVKSDRHREGYMRDYMRQRRQSRLGSSENTPFVGIDGEGGDLPSGYHAYFLLRAGDALLRPSGDNVRLTTSECLRFITDQPIDKVLVGYYFDYDVTKILEDVPFYKLERLMDRSKRMRRDGKGVFPVDWGGYEFDYLPRKEFKVRRVFSESEKGPWVYVNDVGSFFQSRFVEALDKWKIGTADEREKIGIGKEQRSTFTVNDIETILPYNALEIKTLQELMEKFRDACIKTGYLPAKWQGPGQLAEAAFRKHKLPLSKNVPLLNDPEYDDLLTFSRQAFYGGRPELSAIGPVDRPLYQWDINSAYPSAMLSVPCLIHGRWEKKEYKRPRLAENLTNDYAIYYGSFTAHPFTRSNKRPVFFGLPIRTKDGSIHYPASGRGWYWAFEIRASIHQTFRVETSWEYTRECDCTPLDFVRDLYAERISLGKNDAGIVLKLLLNSLYGKTVQSIGSPKYANPIWGSYITAHCRAQIQSFIHSSPWCTDKARRCGQDIVMIATDSLCTFNVRDDIVPSENLGGWSVEEHPRGMFLVQPGLYFGSSSKGRPKTRGVPRSVMETMENDFRVAFQKMVSSRKLADGDVTVPQTMFCGIRYALHRHNVKLLGQWIEFEDPDTGRTGKTIKFDWTSKRREYPVVSPIPGIKGYIETFPKDGDPNTETVPYSKDIGGVALRAFLRTMFLDPQPDWVPMIEPVVTTDAD